MSDPAAARVVALAEGHHDLDGTWLNGGQAAVLSVDVAVGAALPGSGTGCWATLLLGANVTVRTRDGVLAGQAMVLRFDDPWSAWLEVPLPDLSEAYARPDPALPPLIEGWTPAGGRRPTEPVPTLILTFAEWGVSAALIVDRQRLVGSWSSHDYQIPRRQAGPYLVPPELVGECAPSLDYTGAAGQYTAFENAAAAAAAIAGNWIRCRAFGGPPHAGLQISPDGTWRTLTWRDGGLVTQGGFQQEGFLEDPIDTSDYNGAGFFQINLPGPGVWHSAHLWGDRLIMPDDTAPPTLGVSVYVRTSRVPETASNPYASGQRAGTAACAVPEMGTIDPDLGAELQSTLAGEWTLCSGDLLAGYAGLRFDGLGNVTFLDNDGQVMGMSSYSAMQPMTIPVRSPRDTALLLEDQTSWRIIFSDRPLKLWISETSPRTRNRVAVFSPLP